MSVKIDQAFINTFIDSSFGLDIAHDNLSYDPTVGTEYAELINIPNDITAFTLDSSNETDGIFRVILRYPVNVGSINAKIMAESILTVFSVGTEICYSSQCAIVRAVERNKGIAEDGWYKIILTISYFAEITR
jgi:hypothetical protein